MARTSSDVGTRRWRSGLSIVTSLGGAFALAVAFGGASTPSAMAQVPAQVAEFDCVPGAVQESQTFVVPGAPRAGSSA